VLPCVFDSELARTRSLYVYISNGLQQVCAGCRLMLICLGEGQGGGETCRADSFCRQRNAELERGVMGALQP